MPCARHDLTCGRVRFFCGFPNSLDAARIETYSWAVPDDFQVCAFPALFCDEVRNSCFQSIQFLVAFMAQIEAEGYMAGNDIARG